MTQAAMPATPPVTPVAPVSGGGAVATDQLVPVLQSLVGALEGLVAALQGGAVIGGGAAAAAAPAATGAMGAPTAAASQAESGAGHAGHAHGGGGKAKGGGHAHGGGGTHKGHHGMTIIERDRPVDEARARQNLDAVYQTFRTHTRAGLDFKFNNTHGYLSAAERQAFRRQFPGLPVPQSLVFKAGSNVPLGVVYRNNEGPFDLGMGTKHTHADNPKSQMQHIYFTPDDLNLAFSDVEHGMTGGIAAMMKKRGYPTG